MVGYCLCLYFGFASLLNISIENGNVVEIKDLGDEIYDMDIGDDEWLELCKKFEKNSEILLDWMCD